MLLGQDIASYANDRTIDRIILPTGDADCLPTMKRARTAGLQVVLVQFPKRKIARDSCGAPTSHSQSNGPGKTELKRTTRISV